MATLIKEHEGIIYNDYFQDSSLLWTLTPSDVDCIRFNQDGLKILHNKNYITYTFKEPNESYCLITEIEHTPLNNEDVAGLIVLSNTDEYAECQTYLATSPSTIGNNGENLSNGTIDTIDLDSKYVRYTIDPNEDEDGSESGEEPQEEDPSQTVINYENNFEDKVYKFLKLIKNNVDNVRIYQFLASHNGKEWIEVGTTNYFNACSIGFFLYSTKSKYLINNGNFTIKRMNIYENNYITIKGINILQDFEIVSNDFTKTYLRSDTTFGLNVTNHTNNSVIINTKNFNLPILNAILRIYQKTKYNDTIAQYDLGGAIFGGDIFNITYDIKIFIDNQELEQGTEYDLGILYTKSFRKDIVIYNNEEFALGNLKIKIIAFSEYYNGEEEIGIAFYEENKINQSIDTYTFQNELTIPRLEAHTGTELIMKLSNIPKQEFYSSANDYKFKILIE